MDDIERRVTAAFAAEGDAVVLLGASQVGGPPEALAGTEYLELVHGVVAGMPAIDLTREVAVQKACRRSIGSGLLSSAHDCSDGGLAVALAECCIQGGRGMRASFAPSGRWDAALFGEQQSRIVVSLPPGRLPALEATCREEGVPWVLLGHVGGDSLSLPGLLEAGVPEMAGAWDGGLERALTDPAE
jgi:phosphoribosylformylglycinamidine synthase